MKAKLILIGAIAVIALGAFAYTQQGKAENSVTATEDAKAQQIAEAEARLNSIKDKESQEYKEAKQQFCELRARPEAERAQAVANVKEFVRASYPTSSKDYPVTFDCGRGNYEYYESAKWQFIVDPTNNHIIEMGEAPRSWGDNPDGTRWFDEAPEYDYTARYNAEEAGEVAEKLITDHQGIFGVDITRMTRQYEGTKDGGDGITPGDKVNYFYTWRTKDANGKTTELVAVTITRGGQIVVFDNDTYDLKKNGN